MLLLEFFRPRGDLLLDFFLFFLLGVVERPLLGVAGPPVFLLLLVLPLASLLLSDVSSALPVALSSKSIGLTMEMVGTSETGLPNPEEDYWILPSS